MNRLGLLLVLISMPALPRAEAVPQRLPNVVVILSDDQGWGDLSLNGNSNLSTPNIDQLASDGIQLDRFFVCPVCSPTRAEFLTGRYHPRSGVYSTSAGGERINLRERTIAQAFQAAGYATAAFGKWHNGMQPPYHPNSRGFDEFYGFCSGHWGNYFDPMLEENGTIVTGRGFIIDDLTNHAIEFIQQNAKQPFFLYLPLNTPHSPMQVPDRWWNRFQNKDLELKHPNTDREDLNHTRAALAMCENIDWNVGRIINTLSQLRLRNDTIVVYFCDNGPNGTRWNGGMKGRKGSTDEGGVRSPLIIQWPGTLPGNVKIPTITAAIDLYPTLVDLAGITPTNQRPFDGISLKTLLLSKNIEAWPDRMIFSHWRGRVSVRTNRFRLDHQGKLFDMHEDPGQSNHVTAQHPKTVSRLKTAADEWRKTLLTGLQDDDRPFPIGHADHSFTQIPARDALTHGALKRSNRFPNCTYFRNWKSTDDRITWDAEVLTPGTYEVTLYYACKPENVGVRLELSMNEASLQSTIAVAHDPPLIGHKEDRLVRREGYVKDFKPVSLGTIELEKGRGTLTLKATEIPGTEGIEFRLLMFDRVQSSSQE